MWKGTTGFCGILVLCAAGCGGAGKFIPAQDQERQTLQDALTAWENGRAPDALAHGNPSIQIADAKWKAGQKLESFEILKAEPAEKGKVWFTVKLKMKKPAGVQETRYIVIGNNPLWVFREEDYKQLEG